MRHPKSGQIKRALRIAAKIVFRKGTKKYRKNGELRVKIAKRILARTGLTGTSVERYVELQILCALMGKEKLWIV
jgi:hypothetical protein